LSNVYKSIEVVVDQELFKMNNEVAKLEISENEAFTVDSNTQKNMIIHYARKTAEEIIEDATERSNVMYRDGYIKGLDEGERQYVAYLEQAKQIHEQAHEDKERIFKEYEKEILSLSVDIAEKIIGKHVKENSENLHDIFVTAVNKSIHETHGNVKVWMSVDIINNLMSSDKLKHMKAEFHPDQGLADFECIIETENGTTDAGIENQLEQIKKSFELTEKE